MGYGLDEERERIAMLFPLQAGNFFLPIASRMHSGQEVSVNRHLKQAEGEVPLASI
jgi:hypothetical protein